MTDPRIKKLADLLVHYSVGVQPEDWVWISGHIIAEPLVNEVLRAVLEAGGRPSVRLSSDDLDETNLLYSTEDQLTWIDPTTKTLYDEVDCLISLRATENTRSLSGIDPKKQQTRRKARRGLTETYLKRAAEKDLNWVLTQYPCPAYAQEADMSLSDYEDFVYSATFVDQEDPIQA